MLIPAVSLPAPYDAIFEDTICVKEIWALLKNYSRRKNAIKIRGK